MITRNVPGDVGFLREKSITLFNFGSKLDGMIAGYLGAYGLCESFPALEIELENLKGRATRQLFRKAFSLDISTLDPDARAFLSV